MSEAAPPVPHSICELLAARRSDATAVIYGAHVISYLELDLLARRAAGGLARLGVGVGDRVALWLPNTPAWLVLYFACARLGAVAVAVNTRFRSSEVQDIVSRSGAKVLALWPGFRNIDFRGILADVDPAALGAVEAVVVYSESGGGNEVVLPGVLPVAYGALLEGEPRDRVDGGPESPCNIFTTSGTTRAPKLVLHRQRAIVDHAVDVAPAAGIDAPDAVMLQALPICGVFGLCQTMATLAAGRPMLVTPVFDAGLSVRLIDEHRVTHMNGTDEMMERMLALSSEDPPLASLRYFAYARFNPALVDLPAEAAARGVKLRGLYGMSEVQAFYAMQPEDDGALFGIPGGRVVSEGARVRARDPESGEVLPPGEAGELELLSGPSLMVGYFGNEEATRSAFTADGFVRTGDLGYTLSDHHFVFVSRMGDALRLGGFLVSPGEIESHLESHDAVGGCVVVGVQAPGGPRATAFVQVRSGAEFDEEELLTHCRRGLAGYKVPCGIYPIDEFPTTKSANGSKVQRSVLRELAEKRVTT